MTRPAAGRAARISLASARTSVSRVPRATARSLARWITGPSASGSLNGTPSSITWAPASMAASAMARVPSILGSPAVRYTTNPGLCSKWSAIGKHRTPQVSLLRLGHYIVTKTSQPQLATQNTHVLNAADGEVNNQYVTGRHPGRHAQE